MHYLDLDSMRSKIYHQGILLSATSASWIHPKMRRAVTLSEPYTEPSAEPILGLKAAVHPAGTHVEQHLVTFSLHEELRACSHWALAPTPWASGSLERYLDYDHGQRRFDW